MARFTAALLFVFAAVPALEARSPAAASGSGLAAAHSWQWEVAMDVFEGGLEGFFDGATYPDLKACAGDVEVVYTDLDDAVHELGDKTVASVAKALKDIGGALESGSDAMKTCGGAYDEIKDFVASLKSFTSPWSFVYHVGKDLVVNGKDIFSEINAAEAAWGKQSYREAGVQIGTALHKLFIGRR